MGSNIRRQSFSAAPAGPRTSDGSGDVRVPPPDPAFAEAWRDRLSRTPHANFTLSLDYLAHHAAHGEASHAVLIDEGSRRGAMVLREVGPELVSGAPWRRHGVRPGQYGGPEAARGWGLPWHWLLVGVKDGAVVAGLGLGRYPGGMVDGRASGSSEQAMKAGTNSQVWWELVRRARLDRHNWMNLGGSTRLQAPVRRGAGANLLPAGRGPTLVDTQPAREVTARRGRARGEDPPPIPVQPLTGRGAPRGNEIVGQAAVQRT